MTASDLALKEWAVVVQAMAQGRQLLLLRQGGIQDPGRAFRLEDREFLLYPTWEHQRAELIRPEFRGFFEKVARSPGEAGDRVAFEVYAGVATEGELKDPAALAGLSAYHIWAPEFLESRRPFGPLRLLVLRAYRLRSPILHPVRPQYAGCRSWVHLSEPIPLEGAEPVLDNRRFRAALEKISGALTAPPGPSTTPRQRRRSSLG